jgi:hypothetical protein
MFFILTAIPPSVALCRHNAAVASRLDAHEFTGGILDNRCSNVEDGTSRGLTGLDPRDVIR